MTAFKPLHLVVRMRALPGRGAELGEVLAALVEPTRAEDGCLAYDLLDVEGEEGSFVFVEAWRDPAALEAHGASAHIQAARARYPELLDGSPEVTRAHPHG